MGTLFAWILTMSLGLDTLIVSTSLGLKKELKDRAKIAFVFATVESAMPIAGLFIGGALGHYFSSAVSSIGALLLIGVGIYLFLDDDGEETKPFERKLAGWPLLATAIGISLDELAVGFTAGFIQVPIFLTILLIACQSFIFTFIGVTFGSKIKPILGEWAEKASGAVLALMGIWMLLETFVFP